MREIVNDSVVSIASSFTILTMLRIYFSPGSNVIVWDEVQVKSAHIHQFYYYVAINQDLYTCIVCSSS